MAPQDHLQQSDPWSHQCSGCGRCCHNMEVALDPFQLLCIARHLGITTTEVMQHHTVDGLKLRTGPTGACVFHGEVGCTIYQARPLACRLYPLSRSTDQGERFFQIAKPVGAGGAFSTSATVRQHLEKNNVEAWLSGRAIYFGLYDLAQAHPHRAQRLTHQDWLDADATMLGAGMDPPADPRVAAGTHAHWLRDQLEGAITNLASTNDT